MELVVDNLRVLGNKLAYEHESDTLTLFKAETTATDLIKSLNKGDKLFGVIRKNKYGSSYIWVQDNDPTDLSQLQ